MTLPAKILLPAAGREIKLQLLVLKNHGGAHFNLTHEIAERGLR